jgi:hypothetical protein
MERIITKLNASGRPASEIANRSAVEDAVLTLSNLRSDGYKFRQARQG